jgi:hypothetical protein
MLDPVPKAWCTVPSLEPNQNLSNLLRIYGDLSGDLHVGMTVVVFVMRRLAELAMTTYRPISASPFEPDGVQPETPGSLREYLLTAISQHIRAYCELIIPNVSLPANIGFVSTVTHPEMMARLEDRDLDEIYSILPIIGNILQLYERAREEQVIGNEPV